jgi:hypothetical protein
VGDQLTGVPTLSSREELDVAVVDLRAGVRSASDQDERAELEGALAGCPLERQDRLAIRTTRRTSTRP